MFADVAPEGATEPLGWFTNPWLSTSVTLVVIAMIVGATWWLTRGENFALAREFVAGRVRRLLMKRRAASPTPPPVQDPEAHEAAAPQTAPKEEAPTPPKGRRPAPVDAPAEEAPAWITKALVVVASVPTLLALPWAAYSVAQFLPIPLTIALPLGVLFDVIMVGAVLTALLVPSISRQASFIGWGAALLAAAAIATHTGFSGALIFAATPLASKALWGLLVTIRRQQASLRASRMEEERLQKEAEEEEQAARDAEEARKAAELSSELTFEQQEEIARLEREALYEEKLAAAKLKVKLAKSEAEHLEALAEIKRLGEQKRAEDEESAKVYENQLRLSRKVGALEGRAPAFLESSSPGAIEDAELVPQASAKVGFGGGAPQAFGFQRPLDVRALTPEGATVKFEDLKPEHQELVKYVKTEKEPTVRGAARRFERDPRTIRHWKVALAEYGYKLTIGQ